jgi:hypothetical protein
MGQNKQENSNKEKANSPEKPDRWIEKVEAVIDHTAEKIHKSETYRKADQSVEEATKKIFRLAGR